jgi:predicted dehydrogenase
VDAFPHPENATLNRVARLTFSGGRRGLLKIFQCAGSEVERLEVHSNVQSAYLDGPLWKRPGRIVLDRGAQRRIIDPEAEHPLPEVIRLGIVGEYRAFFDLIADGIPAPSTFQNAVSAMRAAEAIELGQDY